ncbi:hypothetical protein DSUL_90061 [Desulfovibrionales bacterium]
MILIRTTLDRTNILSIVYAIHVSLIITNQTLRLEQFHKHLRLVDSYFFSESKFWRLSIHLS